MWCEGADRIQQDFNNVRLCLISLSLQGVFELFLCHSDFFVYTVMLEHVFQTSFQLVEHIHVRMSAEHHGNLIFERSYWWKI
jgi:hypothetical protein